MASFNQKFSQIEINERVKKANPNISMLSEYINISTTIKCVCNKCSFGTTHDWKVTPNRLFKPGACPICNNKQIDHLVKGFNDLETWCIKNNRFDILDEWDYEENEKELNLPKSPSEITKANPKFLIHWRCNVCGYKWKTTVNKRTIKDKNTGHGSGCPRCSKSGTSESEQACLFYLKKAFPDLIYREKNIIGKELDFYIPSKNTGIEFDGFLFHKNKLRNDNKKDYLCKEKGVYLIRIRDNKLEHTKYAKIIDCSITDKSLNYAILECFKALNYVPNFKVNIEDDKAKIIKAFRKRELDESLAVLFPKLVKEWDNEKNGYLKPENFSPGEKYLAWWKCGNCGYSWRARIYTRTKKYKNHGCPKCGLKKQGETYSKNRAKRMSVERYCIENNLKRILDEWDYEANKQDYRTPDIPSEASYSCNRKIHWKCSYCGHKWTSEPYYRYKGKYNCPKCNNKLVVKGKNDFLSWCKLNKPTLLNEYDYEANKEYNIDLSKIKFDSYSKQKVWWKCSTCGHKWQARFADRTVQNKGCKLCGNLKKSTKSIICVETGKIYSSVKEAGLSLVGHPYSRISQCLKGKCSTALGYHWKYFK